MQLTFWGAAQQVTGSMYILELQDGYRILIDCGLDLDKSSTEYIPDPDNYFPFDPASIDLVLLTHAHVDHSGNIPNLFRYGYQGQVLCTKATFFLTEILLYDSAMLNRKKLEYQNKTHKRSSNKAIHNHGGIFLEKQVESSLENFVTIAFNNKFEIRPGLVVEFIPAGHLLGAAHIVLSVTENEITKTIGFSGDIGRKNYPLLPDPQKMQQVDYLVCETTYGNRNHTSANETAEEILEKIIYHTCVEVRGRLIIPAFSVGRTQAVLFVLNKIFKNNNLRPIKIFADSPMAIKSTSTYEYFKSELNDEARTFDKNNGSIFDFENLHYVENFKQSKQISNYHEPCIILSSSGMITGGRIGYHLQKNLGNPYCTVLMIGYAAENTPGHDLMLGKNIVNIKGKEIKVAANIEITDILSGHAGKDDLIDFIKNQEASKLKKVFLVHGELQSMTEFKATIGALGYTNIECPTKGESFEL
jgi:metallo-beta-lactamase family protein